MEFTPFTEDDWHLYRDRLGCWITAFPEYPAMLWSGPVTVLVPRAQPWELGMVDIVVDALGIYIEFSSDIRQEGFAAIDAASARGEAFWPDEYFRPTPQAST